MLLLDVSVAAEVREMWSLAGVVSIGCIDHHASAIEHWPTDCCPINTESCAALQTWQQFYPGAAIPFWLEQIDRVDRWDNPTYEDRCIREVLNVIAHLPVQRKFSDAFALTDAFILNITTPVGLMGTMAQGKMILDQKDAALMELLAGGQVHTLTEEYLVAWGLPEAWLNLNVFIIDNTSFTLDTTEAAHLVFLHSPETHVFINYRRKMLRGKEDGSCKEMIVYSARTQLTGLDLTAGSVLRGHPTSAGAALVTETATVVPFIISATVTA